MVRRDVAWLTAAPESSVSFTPLHELEGIITPNGLCFERHHAGIAVVDPAQHRLMINGLVEKPLVFTMQDILRFPRTNRVFFLECAANTGMEWRGAQLNGCQFTHGMIHSVMYTGVPLKLILEEAGVKTNARWVMAEGGDAAGMNRSIPLPKALDDCLIAFKMNGEALPAPHGFPARLIAPGWYGIANVKWLTRIEVLDRRYQGHFMARDYVTIREEEAAGETVWTFTSVSRDRLKSAPAKVTQQGDAYRIMGAAWGAPIAGVEVRIDEEPWQSATLTEPGTEFAWAFWELVWDAPTAGEHTITSRAIATDGEVQPAPDDPFLAGKTTYWESTGQITRRISIA